MHITVGGEERDRAGWFSVLIHIWASNRTRAGCMNQIGAVNSVTAASGIPGQVIEPIVSVDVGCLHVTVDHGVQFRIRGVAQSSVLVQLYQEYLRIGILVDVSGTPGQPQIAVDV